MRIGICLLVCILVVSGCSPLKGGDVRYGTVTAKVFRDGWVADFYTVIIKADTGRGWQGDIDESTYNSITFGSRVKMTYTGFYNQWIVEAATP